MTETVIVPREYQIDLLENAIERNIIVPLGTGTGKTFIAVMLLKEMASSTRLPFADGGKRSVFLVDKVPLVRQQAEHIRLHSNLSVGQFHGSMNVDLWSGRKWNEQLSKYQVLVMTAQVFANLLTHGYASIGAFNVIIFDECHHATRNHPYRRVMARYREYDGAKPRILGLTASVVNSFTNEFQFQQMAVELEASMCSKIITTDELVSLHKVLSKPKVVMKVCENDDNNDWHEWTENVRQLVASFLDSCRKSSDSDDEDEKESKSCVADMLNRTMAVFHQLGVWSALRAIQMHSKILKEKLSNCQSEKARRWYCAATTVLHAAIVCMRPYLCSVDSVEKLTPMVTHRVRELLGLLKTMKSRVACLTSNKQQNDSVCGIVFVTQRYVAFHLRILLETVKKWDEQSYGFYNVDFVIGCSNVKDRTIIEQNRRQEETLRNFRSGRLNLLISTSILEEGVDVPRCNYVIRFDPPKSFVSFIQSKGRARAAHSLYVVLMEMKDKFTVRNMIQKCLEMEQKLLNYESPEQEEDVVADYIDSLAPAYYGPKTDEQLGGGQAVLTLSNALSVLYRYCSSLVHDEYTRPVPVFKLSQVEQLFGSQNYVAVLSLPLSSSITTKFTSEPMRSVKLAKMYAALEACKALHKSGKLNDNFLPASTFQRAQMDDDMDVFDDQVVVVQGRSKNRTCYARECYKKKVAWHFAERLQPGRTSFLHSLSITDLIVDFDLNMNLAECSKKAFCIISSVPIPPLPSFEIVRKKDIQLVKMNQQYQEVSLTSNELTRLYKVQRYIFVDLLKFDKLYYSPEKAPVGIVVAPVCSDENGVFRIDWPMIDDLINCIDGGFTKPMDEKRRRFQFHASRYEDAVLVPWYRPIRNYILVSRVEKNLYPTSVPDFGRFLTYTEYYKCKYDVDVYNPDQLMLAGEPIKINLDMIHRDRKRDNCDALMTFGTSSSGTKRYGSVYVPELVHIHPIPKHLWLQMVCLPTILYRLNCLLVAEEFRAMVQQQAFSDDAKPEMDHQWSPVDRVWYDEMNNTRQKKECNGLANNVAVGKLIEYDGMEEDHLNETVASAPSDDDPYATDVKEELLYFPTNKAVSDDLETASLDSDTDDEEEEDDKGDSATAHSADPKVDSKQEPPPPPESFHLQAVCGSKVHGPEPRDILLALTACAAEDHFNYESLETLGDSFLKYATSVSLFKNHPDQSEGYLTCQRIRQINNNTLCKLGKRVGLQERIVDQRFRSLVNWLPPGFVNLQIANCDDGLDDYTMHLVSDKSIADCVEALIGVYLRSCGSEKTVKFMEWLGIDVSVEQDKESEVTMKYQATTEDQRSLEDKVWLTMGMSRFESILGYEFKNRRYLLEALTHSSYTSDWGIDCYQRLEFLGDAVLDYLVTRYLFEVKLSKSPGLLTDLRSALVNNTVFAFHAVKHDFHKFMMDRSPSLYTAVDSFVKQAEALQRAVDSNTSINHEIDAPKVLGDLFESVAGAIYLDSDGSLETVWQIYSKMINQEIDLCCENPPRSPIRELYQLEQNVVFSNWTTADSDGMVQVTVTIDGGPSFTGTGKTRLLAKNAAAKLAICHLQSANADS